MLKIFLDDYTSITIELPDDTDKETLSKLLTSDSNNFKFIRIKDTNNKHYIINTEKIMNITID